MGLVALNVTVALNPAQQQFRVPTLRGLDAFLRKSTEELIMRHQHRWLPPRDPRTRGILFEFRCVALVEEGPLLVPGASCALQYTGPMRSPDRELVQSLARLIGCQAQPHGGGLIIP